MIVSKPSEMRYRGDPYLGMIFITSTLICPGLGIAEGNNMQGDKVLEGALEDNCDATKKWLGCCQLGCESMVGITDG